MRSYPEPKHPILLQYSNGPVILRYSDRVDGQAGMDSFKIEARIPRVSLEHLVHAFCLVTYLLGQHPIAFPEFWRRFRNHNLLMSIAVVRPLCSSSSASAAIRFGKSVIPSPFRIKFREDASRKGILLKCGKAGCNLESLLKKLCHVVISEAFKISKSLEKGI